MKHIALGVIFLFMVSNFWAQDARVAATNVPVFGQGFDGTNILDAQEMSVKYQNLSPGDTLQAKFSAKVTEVCQAKGCWMKLQLEDGSQAMVRFKDYGFFVPKDIAGKEVAINGKAFVEEMGVEDQKHFAKDAGKSEIEIARITAPKKTFGFEAEGVLLKQ